MILKIKASYYREAIKYRFLISAVYNTISGVVVKPFYARVIDKTVKVTYDINIKRS